ncbi:MAG: cadherin-like domain-containing protein, partial [Cyanobacteria bacterium P01_G01_bin.4]
SEVAAEDSLDAESDVVGAAPSVPAPPANANPIPIDDTGSTQEDTPLSFGPTDLLANDSDPDGDTLTIASVQDASNGEVVLNDDGTIAFTPNADISGQGSFSYTVADGNGGFDTATVDIELAPVNDAPIGDDDTGTTPEDTPLALAAADLLANDSDLDGDPLAIASVQDATNGSATLNPDGSVAFTPNADFNGQGGFSYTVDDGNGSTAIARVTVDITPTNDAPVGGPDVGTIDQGTSLTLATAELLANDSDVDGDVLAVASVQEASSGSVTLNTDNTVTFTPRPDFSGQATFTYTLSDGSDTTDTVTVTVTINAVAPAPPPEQPPAPDAPDELAPDAEPDPEPGYVPPSTNADDLLAPIPEAPSSDGEGN